MNDNKNNTYNSLFHFHSLRIKLVIEGIAVGAIAGLLVVLYRYILGKALKLVLFIYKELAEKPGFIPLWILLLMIIGLIIGLMVKHEPMISGSGIPQAEGVLQGKLKMVWWRVIIGKFLGGVLAIGSGLSLGREGPSVQLGAAVGQGFGKVFKRIYIEEKFLITAGASAGLSAAFNAPLAGLMFALEEVHKNFSPLILLSSLSAALSADYVSSIFFGLKPVFNFSQITAMPLDYYAYIALLGVILGIFGALFNVTLLKTQDLYAKLKWIPKELRIIIPLMLSVGLGFYLPQVLGGGHELIVSITENNPTLIFLLILLFTKFLFTMASFGSGAPGGIFLPLLSVGALIGSTYGTLLAHILHIDSSFIVNFMILAMAGYFTAVVRAPITGIILITEMTGSLSHLLSISLVSITAYIVADLLGSKPVYESLLERILHKQNESPAGNKKHKEILEFAVSLGSITDGRRVKDIKWPQHCLLVAIRRGDQEIIPKGDNIIQSGDYLVVLTNVDNVSGINDAFVVLTGYHETNSHNSAPV